MKRTIIQIDKQLDRQISAFFSKNLDKYEYLTDADLDLKPSTAEKAKLEYSPLGMSFNKSFNKNEVKSLTKNKSNFNYDIYHAFFKFYEGYDEFKEMSLVSKYNRMKECNFFLTLKALKQKKTKTQIKK